MANIIFKIVQSSLILLTAVCKIAGDNLVFNHIFSDGPGNMPRSMIVNGSVASFSVKSGLVVNTASLTGYYRMLNISIHYRMPCRVLGVGKLSL
jgi:hypothetical protein